MEDTASFSQQTARRKAGRFYTKKEAAMKYLFVILVVLAGVGIPIQAAANKKMQEAVESPALAVTLAFVIGAVAMLVVTLSGVLGRGHPGTMFAVPWWGWIGGLLSAAVVTVSLIGVQKAGAGPVIAGTVFGQLICALVLDNFGWLGVKHNPINAWKIAGAVFLFIGVLLMQKNG